MPRGDKSKYTDKQERKADHIAESYESRGVSGEGGGATRLGHRQQGRRWRQGARRLGPRQIDRPSRRAPRRPDRRRRFGRSTARRSIGRGQEGGGHKEAERRARLREIAR